jgi:UDP-2-acetamido-2,6-beta-L-arabino-hexul-4-ose reductase
VKWAITGADGLLGRHARALLHATAAGEVVPLRHGDLDDPARLALMLADCDSVWHFAGINRATDPELEQGNIVLARTLDAALTSGRSRATVIYASSTQAVQDTPYGRGKRIGGEVLATGAAARGTRCVEMVLPNVFGEGARPNYNSVVANFIDHLGAGTAPTLNPDGRVELLHAGAVAEQFRKVHDAGGAGRVRPEGVSLGVPELWERLSALAGRYRAGVIPLLSDPLDRALFNAFRYSLFPGGLTHRLPVHADDRGDLLEVIRHSGQGQCFVSSTRPGKVRGRHWHRYKVERFCALRGEAVVRLRPVLGTAVTEVRLSGTGPQVLDIPTLHVHEVENVGPDDMLMAFWADEHYDPAASDTYPEPVLL